MKKSKISILTGLPLMCIACPALAEPSHTSSTFPNDELMQEDYTYQNQANYTNMGIYEGDITANAEYDDILYQIAAGTYLAAGQTTASTCTAGNFCIGVTDATYNANSNQGLTSCATVGDTTYTQSAAGASADTDCYKACTTSDVAHSATVSGNNYYGDGEDTCSADSCVAGYHVHAETLDVENLVGTAEGVYFAEVGKYGYFKEHDWDEVESNNGINYYGLSTNDPMSFAVDYGDNGIIRGHARCSTTPGDNNDYAWTNPTIFSTLTDETGEIGAQYCYCQVDGYKASSNATMQSLSAPWVFVETRNGCQEGCTFECAISLLDEYRLGFRSAVLGAASGGGLASCEANTINITWTDASAADIAANNAGTATYDGDIRTPAAATDKTNIGKRFKGWRFTKPTPVQQ